MTTERARQLLLCLWMVSVGAACAPDGREGIQGLGDRSHEAAFAVTSTDYTATTVSLLRADGSVLVHNFVHSGSAPTGLVTALSGDVALPTPTGEVGILTLIDRFRTDVVTRIDLTDGRIIGQVKTHTPNHENQMRGYASNPQDYALIDDDNAWVSRHEPNIHASASDPDRGNDLLHVDPTSFERTGRRIDFEPLNGRAQRKHPRTGVLEQVPVYARPGRIVPMGRHLIVGTTRLSQTFDAIGAGMVALVDLSDAHVEGVPIPGLQSCGSIQRVADDPLRVVVACVGFFRENQRDTAGLALLRFEDGALHVEHVWRVGSDDQAALAVFNVVAIGGSEVIAVAPGELEDAQAHPHRQDRVYRVDIATGEQQLVFEAEGRWSLGSGAYNPALGMLMIPDGSTDTAARPTAGIRRFRRNAADTFEALDVIPMHPILPVRQIAAL